MKRRGMILVGTGGATALLLLGAAGVWWAHYPKPPDAGDTSAAIKFIGSDEFNRMTEGHRRRYATAALEELGRKSDFPELLRMTLNKEGDLAPAFRNIRKLPDHEPVSGTVLRIFLDKFYQQDKAKRSVYLTVIAVAQQGEIGKHPERFGLPSAEQFKADFGRFLSSQPTKVQAQMGQFLLDVRRQREGLGLKEPF